jgi:dolichol-phosphate mannosyltransferase|nr:glycosyltransferase family 2 protein [Brucella anthropi]
MKKIAVVIPTYKAQRSILGVLSRIPEIVSRVYVVDDMCPDNTGALVEAECKDDRVFVIRHEFNRGVGGAVKTGYKAALADGFDLVVKIDSDGQMAPEILEQIAAPVIAGTAHYSKGNRFWNVSDVKGMPVVRIIGNAGVSFLSKLSTGYWHIFDPSNGYTVISREALETLPLEKIADRYFFESDMLFRLALDHRSVADVPMKAVYADEESHLSALGSLFSFGQRYASNFFKRIFYEYILRDFNTASLSLIVALITLPLGLLHGGYGLISGWITDTPSSSSSVALTSLLLIVGYVSLLNFLAFDYAKGRR